MVRNRFGRRASRASPWLSRANAIWLCVLAAGCARSRSGTETKGVASTTAASPADGIAVRPVLPGSLRPPVDDMDLAAAERALGEASKALGAALAAGAPDCELARVLRDRICELADRICRLAGADPENRSRCEDGRSRCADAKDKVASSCP